MLQTSIANLERMRKMKTRNQQLQTCVTTMHINIHLFAGVCFRLASYIKVYRVLQTLTANLERVRNMKTRHQRLQTRVTSKLSTDRHIATNAVDYIPYYIVLMLQTSTANLERVRKMKTRHQRLQTRVTTVREELQSFLEDDDDMMKMCLMHKKEQEQHELVRAQGRFDTVHNDSLID